MAEHVEYRAVKMTDTAFFDVMLAVHQDVCYRKTDTTVSTDGRRITRHQISTCQTRVTNPEAYMVAALAALTAISLPGKPQCAVTQQNTTDLPELQKCDTSICISATVGWSGYYSLRYCKALRMSVHTR